MVTQKVLPIMQIVFMYLFAIVGAALIAAAGILVFLTVSGPVGNRSPGISLGYRTVRIIPVIRRESLISDIRRHNKQRIESLPLTALAADDADD